MKKLGIGAMVVLLCGTVVLGNWLRPGREPRDQWVRWADPFDNYTQWAYDNEEFWVGGPVPAGDPDGTLPNKSDDNSGCDVNMQTYPWDHQMAKQQWQRSDCPKI